MKKNNYSCLSTPFGDSSAGLYIERKENPHPVGRILSSEPGHSFCLEGGKTQVMWLMVWLEGQGFRKNTTGKLVT